MNNTELTLDQLAEIAGGLTGRTICSIKKTNPQWDVICDVGASVKGDLKTGDLHLDNTTRTFMGHQVGNDIDGTSGSWTFQEGSADLYLLNNMSGKRYKINLTEV